MKVQKLLPFFVGVFVALLITGGTVLYAAWSEPVSSPPTCNTGDPGCDVPLNTGSADQTKTGNLRVGGSTFLTDVFVKGSNGAGNLYFGDGTGAIVFHEWYDRFVMAPEESGSWQWGKEFGYNPAESQWYVETPLRVGSPSQSNDAATRGYVDGQRYVAVYECPSAWVSGCGSQCNQDNREHLSTRSSCTAWHSTWCTGSTTYSCTFRGYTFY